MPEPPPPWWEFFRAGELVKTHPRKERGRQTDLGDYPPEKIAFHQRTPDWCRRSAAEVGPATAAVVAELLTVTVLFGLRAAQGVVGLADKHDPARLEAACAKATAAGDPSYRTIKAILAAGTQNDPTTRPGGDRGAPAHLHGPEQLFAEVIALPTAATTTGAALSAATAPAPPHTHAHWPSGAALISNQDAS